MASRSPVFAPNFRTPLGNCASRFTNPCGTLSTGTATKCTAECTSTPAACGCVNRKSSTALDRPTFCPLPRIITPSRLDRRAGNAASARVRYNKQFPKRGLPTRRLLPCGNTVRRRHQRGCRNSRDQVHCRVETPKLLRPLQPAAKIGYTEHAVGGEGSPSPSTGLEVIAPGRPGYHASREPNPACGSANLHWDLSPTALSRSFPWCRGGSRVTVHSFHRFTKNSM